MTKMQDLIAGKDFDALLTDEEAIAFLNLGSRPNPSSALRYLCRKHGLPYVDLGRGNRRYRRTDLIEFIERKLVTH